MTVWPMSRVPTTGVLTALNVEALVMGVPTMEVST